MPSEMHDKIIDGRTFSADLRGRIAQAVDAIWGAYAIRPGLAVVLVGEDPASQAYVRSKAKATRETGMVGYEHRLPADTTQVALLELIGKLNWDPAVHGILVQLPLPAPIDTNAVIGAIDPAKDVDGFHIENAGRLFTSQPSLVPCTPKGCVMLLKDRLGKLDGMHAVVLGRSNIVGKPIAQLLLAENCTVTMAHSRSRDLAGLCRQADILVAAVGHPEMVCGNWIKPGATVIDVGINRIQRGEASILVGDVDFKEAIGIAGAITPVPGGVGPMTIACLLDNTVEACCRQLGISRADLVTLKES